MAVRILYDGACPFCNAYVRYARLRRRVGAVELIDARRVPGLIEDYAARGYEIDDSFIVDDGRRVLVHGAAMAFIHGKLAPRWTGLPFLADARLLEAVYPSLRAMRNAALRVLGVPLIAPPQDRLKPRSQPEKASVEAVQRDAGRPEAS